MEFGRRANGWPWAAMAPPSMKGVLSDDVRRERG
jgi:hypothetical protein